MFVLLNENGDAIVSSDEGIRYVNNQAVVGYKKPVFYSQYNESNSSIVERDYFDSATELSNKKSELIAKQKSDLAELATALSSALLEDGAEEQSNVALLRAKRDQVRAQFQADMIALITGGV